MHLENVKDKNNFAQIYINIFIKKVNYHKYI